MAQSTAFEGQLSASLAEGVFQKFPALKVVLIESGFTWLPQLMWRTSKTWRGVRPEVPWIDRPPADIMRDHVRFTLQPVDAPADRAAALARTLEHIGSDRMLLFSTDYPHWHFDGEDVLPDGLSDETVRRIMIDNPLEAYPRLRERRRPATGAQDRGDGAMNIPVRQHRARAAAQRLAIVDCDIHPAFRTPTELHPVPARALAGAHGDLRRAPAPRPVRAAALSAHDGGRHARRCVSRSRDRPAPISS